MISAVSNASRFLWQDWLIGIWRSAVSGGAGAVVASITVALKDPRDWGIHSGSLYELMATTFAGTALLHMFMFLQNHPVPDKVEEKPA